MVGISGVNTNDTAAQLPSTLSVLLGSGGTNDGSNGLNAQPGSVNGGKQNAGNAGNAGNAVVGLNDKKPKNEAPVKQFVKQKSEEEMEGDYNKNSTNMYQDPKRLATGNLDMKDELMAQEFDMENMIMEMATPESESNIPHAFGDDNNYNNDDNGGLQSEGL